MARAFEGFASCNPNPSAASSQKLRPLVDGLHQSVELLWRNAKTEFKDLIKGLTLIAASPVVLEFFFGTNAKHLRHPAAAVLFKRPSLDQVPPKHAPHELVNKQI